MASNDKPRGRVFWTDREKSDLIHRAESIQRMRPDLAGLPLLRAAIRSMPTNRRRNLVSLTQVPWFEERLQSRAKAVAEAKEGASEQTLDELLVVARAIQAGVNTIIEMLNARRRR